MKVIMFAGPGCVGKTTQLNSIVEKAEAEGRKVAFHKSSTRKSYEAAGLKKEDEALEDPSFNQMFQDKVYDDNLADLLAAITQAKIDEVELFIADRSPFDYIGYYFTVFKDYLTIAKIEEKRNAVKKAMKEIYELNNDTQIVPFLYPVHWSSDTNSSDGWRADKTGKNFIWGSIVLNEIKMFEVGHESIPTTPSPEALTDFIYVHCFPETVKQEQLN